MRFLAKAFLLHLPLCGMLLILGFFGLIDAGYISSLRSESAYGWMLLVWYPLSALLGLIQIAVWIGWISKRGIPFRTLSQQARRIVIVGFLVAAAIASGVFVFRMAQRWGFLE